MKQQSILIVEPDATFARTLAQALGLGSEACYKVEICGSAHDAGKLLEATRFDLMLCEYDLPDDDGLTLIARARECNPGLLAVLMTGTGSLDVERRAHKVSQGYLTKPFDMLDLLLVVQDAFQPVISQADCVQPASDKSDQHYAILILEDDAGLRKIYSRALRKSISHKIDEAATLDEARALLDKQDYDILISDVRIGRDRATDILAEYGEKFASDGTKVVMCSAFGQYRNLPAKVDYFLEKPISLEKLVNLVSRLTSTA